VVVTRGVQGCRRRRSHLWSQR